MRPCYNEITTMETADLLEDIENARAAGFRDMEIRVEKLMSYMRRGGTLQQLKKVLDQAGIQVACLNALHNISYNNSQQQQSENELCELYCYCARELGCRDLEVITPYDIPETPEAIHAETVRSLQILSKVARPYDVRLSIEYMGLKSNTVHSFNDALAMVRDVGEDNVGLVVDTWHHYASGSTVEDILQAKAEEIFIVHLSDAPEGKPFTIPREACTLPGTGAIPLTAYLQALHKVGYNSIASVEVFDPTLKSLPAAECVKKAYETTRTALEKAGVLD